MAERETKLLQEQPYLDGDHMAALGEDPGTKTVVFPADSESAKTLARRRGFKIIGEIGSFRNSDTWGIIISAAVGAVAAATVYRAYKKHLKRQEQQKRGAQQQPDQDTQVEK